MEMYPGQHAFEDLMSRAEPTPGDRFFLVDLAAELHINEADLGYFAWQHLGDEDYQPESGMLSEQGAELLRTFLSKDV